MRHPEDSEERILSILRTRPEISPGELSAETNLAPRKLMDALNTLSEKGLALVAPDNTTPDEKVVFLTRSGWLHTDK